MEVIIMATFNCVFVGSEGDIIELVVCGKKKSALRLPKWVRWGRDEVFTLYSAEKISGKSRWNHADSQAFYKARRAEYRFLKKMGY
jgi:hypothetical protein